MAIILQIGAAPFTREHSAHQQCRLLRACVRSQQHLGAATWVGEEGEGAKYMWPHVFHLVGQEYERRYGLKYEHPARIAEINVANARRNPFAQTRDWRYTEASFTADDEANPVIEAMIRRQDCGQ